jgi:TPR repeat protein
MAMQWFLRAAEQGQVDAQAHLGAYYWAGRGVSQDLIKAYMWSAIALARGDQNSKSRLEGLASQMTRQQVSEARQQAEIWIHNHSQPAKSDAN